MPNSDVVVVLAAAGIVLLLREVERAVRRRLARRSDVEETNGVEPGEGVPYRHAFPPPPDIFLESENQTRLPLGPLRSCPECGAVIHECTHARARRGRTDRRAGDTCACWEAPFPSQYVARPDLPLNFTCGTSVAHPCTPHRRVFTRSLWRALCTESGIHVHQKCERCGWRGVSFLQKETSDAA